MGFGGGKSSSSSKPVTWQNIMTPYQISAMKEISPGLTEAGMQGLQGYGLSPQERARQTSMMSGGIADYAGGQRSALRDRSATLGQRGGVVSGAHENIDAAKIMAFGQGLRSIEDMNQQLAQQKLTNLLSFVTWHPPTAQESKSSGFNFALSAPG